MLFPITRVMLSTIVLTAVVAGSVSAAVVPYEEGFETGYADGAQLTANGWTLAWNNDFTVGSTSGKDGGWGTMSNGAQAAIFTSHGSTFEANDLVRAEVDIKLDNSLSDANLTLRDSTWSYGMQVRFCIGEIRWCCENVDDPNGSGNPYDYVGRYAINAGEIDPEVFVDQWFHIQVDWTVGGTATLSIVDEGGASILMEMGEEENSPVESVTVDWTNWLPVAAAGTMQYINIGDSGGSAFDNLKISSIPVSTPIPGDANKDGKVDGSDVTILAGNWQAGVGNPDPNTVTWNMGDFNHDGQVDGSDVTILAGNWQAGVTSAAASVPEPGTVLLLLTALLTSITLIRFRNR